MATTVARVVGPRDGKLGKLGGIGIRFMVGGAESGGGFALVEHPMGPRADTLEIGAEIWIGRIVAAGRDDVDVRGRIDTGNYGLRWNADLCICPARPDVLPGTERELPAQLVLRDRRRLRRRGRG